MWWVNERNRRWSKKITAQGLRGTGVGRPPPSPTVTDAWCSGMMWFYSWKGVERQLILHKMILLHTRGTDSDRKAKTRPHEKVGWTLMPRAHCKYRVELGVIRILSYGSLRHLIFTPYPSLFPFSLPALRQLVLEPCSLWLWRSPQDTGSQPCVTISILEFSR